MKTMSLLFAVGIILFCLHNAHAQYNSRNWINITQSMTGGGITQSANYSTLNSVSPFKYYSLAVTPSQVASWSVVLEGSNDQASWAPITTSAGTSTSIGQMVYEANANPALYLRVRAASLTSSQSITVTALGVP